MRIISLLFLILLANASYAQPLSLIPVIKDLPASWGITVMPNQSLLITHRAGGLSMVNSEGKRQIVEYTPDDLYSAGQGGLLDVKLHPEYKSNRWVYLSYSSGTEEKNRLKIVRFRLPKEGGRKIEDLQTIFSLMQSKDTPAHNAGRMLFDANGALLVTSGDGFDYREQAQIIESQLGKILRMSDEGVPLKSNPFYAGEENPASYVFTLGHRNAQGLIMLNDGTIVSHEHGPDGGDEINIVAKGKNYGWPVATKGMDYIGATISPFSEYEGMESPALGWTPSIAPSSMIFYANDKHPQLQHAFLITSLKNKRLYIVDKNYKEKGELFADEEKRLRDIATDNNGNIYILSDGKPAILYKLAQN